MFRDVVVSTSKESCADGVVGGEAKMLQEGVRQDKVDCVSSYSAGSLLTADNH